MHKLMEYICNELEELERKADKEGKLSAAEIEYGDMLAHFKKNLLRADELWEDSEYSEASGRNYYSRARGGNQGGGRGGQGGGGGRSSRGSYEGRYARNENAYEDGSFEGGTSMARGRGRNARRDSMGRYSRDKSDMIEDLQELMEDAPDDRTRQEFQRFITKMEQM